MMKNKPRFISILWFVIFLFTLSTPGGQRQFTASAHPQAPALPAFPGAEGFGAAATGGRGGQILKVTNLNASGSGSLQWALNQSGPRIIVFAVSGVIEGDVNIPHGNVTIAGQTAPGAGITIHGHLYTEYCTTFGNIIIRHIRVRPPEPGGDWPAEQHDAIQFSCNQLIILDHVDFSHGVDENLDMWGGAKDVTVQWSAITFPVYDGGHEDGPRHNYGMLNGPGGGSISVHHNLFAHNASRNPALAEGPAEVINNVVYNFREGFVHHNPANGNFNLIGNSYKTGSINDNLSPFWFDPENCNPPSQYWLWNNRVDDPGVFSGRVDNPFANPAFSEVYGFYDEECVASSQFNQSGEFNFSSYPGHEPVTTQEPAAAYDDVLEQAGAWPRDIVNTWAVADVKNRTGQWANRRPANWLEGLTPGTAPADGDNDGMPNAWESAHGLNPADGSDPDTVMTSGYTAIEEYINGLADSITPGGVQAPDFALALTPATQKITPGESAVYTLSVQPSGGFSGTITLAANNPSPDVAITINPASLTLPGQTSATVTVADQHGAPLVPIQEYAITISATSGSLSHSASAELRVGSNQAPAFPANPDPANNASNVAISKVLRWQGSDADGDALSYAVAFGTSNPPANAANVTAMTYDPSLEISTTYYWQISASDGISTTVGPVWQFTTSDSAQTRLYLPVVMRGSGGSSGGGNGGGILGGCQMFPPDYIFNTPVNTLPLHPNSSAYIDTIGRNTGFHADFGSGTWNNYPIGIPYNLVPGTQPKLPVIFRYDDESAPGPYPIPANPLIEGNPNSGDRHILIVDTDNCILYETSAMHRESDGWHGDAGAIFDLGSYELWPDTWTSADAAGMPMLPLLVRYDEVAAGEIRHAIRFTAEETRASYVWPARHQASDLTGPQYPPMGQYFRLKAGYDISGFSPQMQVILKAMKTYGIILADNGSPWYFSGVPDERWDNDMLHEIDVLTGDDFEAVDVSGLMIDPDSGQARQR